MPPVGRLLSGSDIKGIRTAVEAVAYSIEKHGSSESGIEAMGEIIQIKKNNGAVLRFYYSVELNIRKSTFNRMIEMENTLIKF